MGTRRKKRPEFELPPLLINTVSEYLGPRATNKLSNDQAKQLMDAANQCATEIGKILESAGSLADDDGRD